MTRYEQLARKALGLLFVVGPSLWLLAAIFYATGIGRNPAGGSNSIEGVFIIYATSLFIPIYLELARRLGQHAPVFGLICALLGLLGMTGGAMMGVFRVLEALLNRVGLQGNIYDALSAAGAVKELGPVAFLPLFGPLTPVLFGIGLLLTRGVPRWSAILLIVGGVSFFLAQAVELVMTATYILATSAWWLALAPLGWQYLTTANHAPAAVRAMA